MQTKQTNGNTVLLDTLTMVGLDDVVVAVIGGGAAVFLDGCVA